MAQPSAADAKLSDRQDNLQIADRQSAITTVTITGTGTAGASYTSNEQTLINAMKADIAALKVAQDLLISALEAHGLVADN